MEQSHRTGGHGGVYGRKKVGIERRSSNKTDSDLSRGVQEQKMRREHLQSMRMVGEEEVLMTAKRRRKILAVSLAGMALLAGMLALGCGGEPGTEISGKDAGGAAGSGGGTGISLLPESGTAREEAYAGGRAGGTAGQASGSALPELKPKVVKNAVMKMETEQGGYAELKEDALAVVSASGGYVQGESSSRDDDGLVHATLTLRIPAEAFDKAMTEISGLGEVISTQVNTSDVSSEYVDLEARLRHLQAEEAFYLSLIGRAGSVQEMISIREHLSSVQLEKEQVQGRMNFLDQQVEYSTITLSVDEVAPGEGKGFWSAVKKAFKSFGKSLRAVAVGFFYALPYLIIAAVIAAAVWYLKRRRRGHGSDERQTS